MTDREKRIAEIRERVGKATAGPWTDHESGIFAKGGGQVVWVYPPDPSKWEAEGTELEDSHFIAYAREDVPWLLALVDEYKGDPAERTYLECRVRNLEGDLAFYLNEDPDTKAKVDRWREIMDKAPHELGGDEKEELATLTGELLTPTPDPDPVKRWCALRRENERLQAEVERLRERLEILECNDEDTRRGQPDPMKTFKPWRKAAFDYPGSEVDG